MTFGAQRGPPPVAGALRVAGASVLSAALCAASVHLGSPGHLLILVALLPWLAIVDEARSWRAALGRGLAFSVAYSVAVTGWFADAAAAYTSQPWPVAYVLLALGAPLLQPQIPVAALVRFAARRRGFGGARVFAAYASSWFAVEWGFPKLLGDTLAHALQPSAPLRQLADVAGAGGLTVMVLAANDLVLAIASAARRDAAPRCAPAWGRPALTLGVVLLSWAAYGRVRLTELHRHHRSDPLSVGVVQSAIVDYDRLARERGRYEVVREVLDVHEHLSSALVRSPGVDLLVWPETVYPTTFGTPRSETGAELDREIVAFASEQRVPLVFGAYDAEAGREYNAAFFLSPSGDGVHRATYRKANLFPLTEWAPGPLGSAPLRRVLPWMGTWVPGPGPRVVTVRIRGRLLPIAPLLCYDAVRPAHAAAQAREGAALLVALSNDAWFAGGPGARLHLMVAAFRAVETRLPLVRAAPSGISALVDASGEIVGATDIGERAAFVAAVQPGPQVGSPFVRLFPVLGPASLAIAAGASLLPRRRARR